MSEHTKEPWHFGTYYSIPIYGGMNGMDWIFSIQEGSTYNPEDVKRIVACVNACAGIPNETLDSSMFRNAILLKSTYLDLQKERDELRTKNAQLELALKQHRDAFELLYEVYKCLLDVRNSVGYEKVMIRNDFLNKAIDVIDGSKLAQLSASTLPT